MCIFALIKFLNNVLTSCEITSFRKLSSCSDNTFWWSWIRLTSTFFNTVSSLLLLPLSKKILSRASCSITDNSTSTPCRPWITPRLKRWQAMLTTLIPWEKNYYNIQWMSYVFAAVQAVKTYMRLRRVWCATLAMNAVLNYNFFFCLIWYWVLVSSQQVPLLLNSINLLQEKSVPKYYIQLSDSCVCILLCELFTWFTSFAIISQRSLVALMVLQNI